jgi:outer membrane murein-binding lipoprotein Lpp
MNSKRQTKWIRVTSATLMVIALLLVASQSGGAQSQEEQRATANLQELKEKLQRLEQTMQELKGQINAAEQTQKTSSAPINGIPSMVGGEYPNNRPQKTFGSLINWTPDMVGGEYPNNRSQKTSAAPINVITPDPALANSAHANVEKTPVTVAPKPAQLLNAESSLEVYGFVMLDMGYQFKQNDPLWFDVVRPTKLPAFQDQFAPNGDWYSSVRQTRFGTRSSIPTGLGELKTLFEFELFGTGVDAGQTTFRLRHAYGELGQFGAGQYWSPFMDIDVFPNQLEYWGPNGMVFFRNLQARWMPIKGDSRVTVAIERPGASADQGIYADRIELQAVRPQFDLPDLSWEARLGRQWGYVELAGIFRRIKWVDTNNDQFDLGGNAFGWGLNLSSNLKFGTKDVGKFQVVYGEGIQNYMNDAPQDVGIRNNFQNPVRPIEGEALPLLGIVAFLDHTWNERLSTAVGYSLVDIRNSDGQAPDAFHQGHYALTNLLWSPVPNFMVGTEFQFGRRLNFRDGFNANDYRIQFSFKYNFSRVFKF